MMRVRLCAALALVAACAGDEPADHPGPVGIAVHVRLHADGLEYEYDGERTTDAVRAASDIAASWKRAPADTPVHVYVAADVGSGTLLPLLEELSRQGLHTVHVFNAGDSLTTPKGTR